MRACDQEMDRLSSGTGDIATGHGGKRKTLALGTYPDVPIARARLRHRAARRLLASGVDPSLKRSELRRVG
jgi:hypothetical protein